MYERVGVENIFCSLRQGGSKIIHKIGWNNKTADEY